MKAFKLENASKSECINVEILSNYYVEFDLSSFHHIEINNAFYQKKKKKERDKNATKICMLVLC